MAIDLDAIVAARNGEPVTPVEPVEPVEPTEPIEPTEPVEPVTDTDPVEPIEPVEPVEPVEPTEPIEPTEPVAEDINLDEIVVEVDGADKSVSELLAERDEMAERIAAVEKDEFLMRLITHRQNGGDVRDFLESQTVDYDKEDNVALLKKNFYKEYSGIDPKVVDLMFQKELKNKYNIDPKASAEDVDTDSDDYKIGQELLKRDAEKARANFKEEQKKFAIPAKVKETAPAAFDQEAYKQQLKSHKDLAELSASKLLKLSAKGEDGTVYGYEVDQPEQLIEMMSNDGLFFSTFVKDGVIDRVKQARVYAYASDPENFEKQLIKLGQTMAIEKTLKEKRNTDGIAQKTKTLNPATDEKSGFLKAALQQKKV